MISRPLYLMFLYYVVLEGAARKWLLPSASNELFLLKDVLLVGAVCALYGLERRQLSITSPLVFKPLEKGFLALWLAVTFIGFTMAGFSFTGLIGLRYYLIPLLILLLQPVLARDIWQFERFVQDFLVLCACICLLGFVQFTSPPDSVINRYSWAPNSEMDVATFGEVSERASDFSYVRITGTFSYISPYAAYLQFAFFCALGMFAVVKGERARLFYAATIAAILANLFMTGSRGPTLGSLLVAVLFVPSLRQALGSRFGFIGVVFGGIALAAGVWLARDIAYALIERNEAAGDASGRISSALLFPFYTIVNSPIWGEGIGATFLGLGQLTGAGGFEYRFDEVMQDRIAVEVGILGYMFFVVFKVYFLVGAWRLYRAASTFDARVWSLVSFSFQLSLMWSIPLYNSVAVIFYFFSIGLFLWLRAEDARSRTSARHSTHAARARMVSTIRSPSLPQASRSE